MPKTLTHRPDPALYRPCVGIMLANAVGKVFVGQRIDSHQEAWQMPQGGIDAGEDPMAATLRELHEETSITADLVQRIATRDDWLYYDLPTELIPHLWGGRYLGQRQKWSLYRFTGTDIQISVDTANPEYSTWQWLPFDELAKRIVPFKMELYLEVMAGFAPHFESPARSGPPS
ncbi:MAG: RNA pyrophosphohydrolase [Rhodobacteraceae bacterium]|nr:RNA pyrophosphohydrolase [Paracoccaceae bacterium]